VQVYYFLYVCQTESEAFDIVTVACVYAVELFEDFAEVFLLDADAGIPDRDRHLAGRRIPSAYVDVKWFVRLAIFYCIVDEIEDDIAEMSFFNEDV
jgi:hypothetical protein